MKNSKTLLSIAFVLSSSVCVQAYSETNTIHGSACQWTPPEFSSFINGYDNPNGYANVRYSRYGIENKNYPVANSYGRASLAETATVVCPLTISKSVGTNATIYAYVQDLQGSNRCRATVRDYRGNHVWKGDWKKTGTTGSSVALNLGSPSVSSNGIDNQVVVECELHPTTYKDETPATVRAVRVY